jgi:hypothetical protein
MTFASSVSVFRSFRRSSSEDDDDRRIREWRSNWQLGAQARWAGKGVNNNPSRPGSKAFAAWSAGWTWAGHHPDRRGSGQSGLAHPYRRSSDTLMRLVRQPGGSAIGLSAITVIGGIIAMRRRRPRTDDTAA